MDKLSEQVEEAFRRAREERGELAPRDKIDSGKVREEGNVLYRQGKYYLALSRYSKALASAGGHSENKGLALANRSAVLMSVGFYKESISDANLALQEAYPDALKYKLHDRLATCFKMLGQPELARENFAKCVALINEKVAGPEKEAVLARVTSNLEKKFRPKVNRVGLEYAEVPAPSYGVLKDLPGVSCALKQLKNKEMNFRASRKINPGDILIVEEPLMAHLCENRCNENTEDESNFTHCFHCFRMFFNLIPCPTCDFAMFCGEECKAAAWRGYHREECSVRNKYLLSRRGEPDPLRDDNGYNNIVNQSIKTVCTFGPDACCRALSRPAEAPPALRAFLGLQRASMGANATFNIKNMAHELAAVWFDLLTAGMGVLRKTKLLAEFIIVAVEILHRNLADLLVSEYEPDTDSFGHICKFGCGLFLQRARLPHSCVPNCTTIVYGGKTLATVALRAINPGEVITVAYKINLASMAVDVRRDLLLSRYETVCNCEACAKNWQPMNYLNRDPILRNDPAISGLHQDLFILISNFSHFEMGLVRIKDEVLFKKCLQVQAEFLEAGVPKTDVVFVQFQMFIENFLRHSARKFLLNGSRGQPFLFSRDRNKAFELKWVKFPKVASDNIGWR